MGFWPFGRDPANVEIVSRVVTATAQNGYRVRAKLTVHFEEPQRQGNADEAADRCAAVAVALLREAPDHGSVIGGEAQLSAELLARYPSSVAKARFIELASVHVVGDPALSDELRRAVSTSAPAGPPTSRPPPPSNTTPPPGVVGPLSGSGSSPSGLGSMRRRGSSQIRSIQTLLMPPGTPPAVMGQFVAPTVKDAAARLLVGFLRAHDLIAVRHAAIDENSAEMLAALVPASDAPPGGYELSRSAELSRWQIRLGDAPMGAIRRELRAVAVYLARHALAVVEVNPTLAVAVVESIASSAFPDDAGLFADAGARPLPLPEDHVPTLAATLTKMAGVQEEPGKVAEAMAPLVAAVIEDLGMSAMIIKASAGS
jgi:hypothetical protein